MKSWPQENKEGKTIRNLKVKLAIVNLKVSIPSFSKAFDLRIASSV